MKRQANSCLTRGAASQKLQAHYHHCGEAASEKCLAAATIVRRRGEARHAIILRALTAGSRG